MTQEHQKIVAMWLGKEMISLLSPPHKIECTLDRQYRARVANLANISFTPVRNEADCIRWVPSCRPVGSSRKL
jgi:hypothetical protein